MYFLIDDIKMAKIVIVVQVNSTRIHIMKEFARLMLKSKSLNQSSIKNSAILAKNTVVICVS